MKISQVVIWFLPVFSQADRGNNDLNIQLDDYEQDILDSVERGKWQSVINLQHRTFIKL